MDTDADMNLVSFFLLGVVSAELGLDLLRALYSMNDRGEVHQKGIPDRFDDRTMMGSHGLLNDLIVDIEQAQHAGFVSAHLAAEAHHVSEHDRGQLARLGSTSLRAFHDASLASGMAISCCLSADHVFFSLRVRNPICRPLDLAGVISSRIASKTALNCASYFFSNAFSFCASCSWETNIWRRRTKVRMISTLTITARSLRRTLESIATPCSVKA